MSNSNKLILCASMPRSGSTWLYNAIRLVLSRGSFQKEKITYGWIDDLDLERLSGTVLVKLHEYNKELAVTSSCIIYSFRDLRDALASSQRMFGLVPTIKTADHYINLDKQWRNVSSYNMKYEEMIADPLKIIHEIIKALNIEYNVSCKEIIKDLGSLCYTDNGNKNSRYNYENLLHKNHITNGRHGTWNGCLDVDLISEVEEKHFEWLSQNNYLIK